LAAGSSLTYTVTIDIPADFDQSATLTNIASVSSTTFDPVPECPGCTDENLPATEADLVVLKTDGRTQFYSDEEATYSITIFNAGPSVAYNVHVTDPLPAGITLLSWTA